MKKNIFLTKVITCLAVIIYVSPLCYGKKDIPSLTAHQPLLFTENRGQVVDDAGTLRPDILFTAHSGNTQIYFTSTGVNYQFFTLEFPNGYNGSVPTNAGDRWDSGMQVKTNTYRFSLKLDGANPNPVIRREKKNACTENFYLPQCPAGITGVATYERLLYQDVYPGIDWVVYSNGSRMKYDFVVRPGSDPHQIKIKIADAQRVYITEAGELVMQTALGEVREDAPVSYAGGENVPTYFRQNSDGTIGFEVGAIPGGATLTIDPSVSWATYYGGASDGETSQGCSVDAADNVYITGIAWSSSGFATTGAFQTSFNGSGDAYITKFSSSGARLWSTYYGGTGQETQPVCATDNFGNVFMAGTTASTTVIASPGAYKTAVTGIVDNFLVKFNASTGARSWGTYYGGAVVETSSTSCATDGSGNVYLSGATSATSGLFVSGGHQPANGGGTDVYLVKFNTSGTPLWGTYYGGAGSEFTAGFVKNVTVDNADNVFLSGMTTSTSAIATAGSYQPAFAGGATDAFLVKFSSLGVRLWSTYYGGPGEEVVGTTCNADNLGNVYLATCTNSVTGIATAGAYQSTFAGDTDVCVAKFNSSGGILWSTYFGGPKRDNVFAISTMAGSRLYLAGSTYSTTGIATAGAMQSVKSDTTDAMMACFDANGSLLWGSYYGGTGVDHVVGCAVNASGDVYFSGVTNSTTGISTTGAYQVTLGGGSDAMLLKISDPPPSTIITGSITGSPFCAGATINVPYSITGTYTAGNIYTAQLSDAAGSFASPVNIGSLTAIAGGTIVAVIPVGTASGSGYRIRVVSSTPVVTGTDNGVNLTVIALPDAGNISGSSAVCESDVITLSESVTVGSWSSSDPATASVSAGGVITGIAAGNATISYTASNTCGTAVAVHAITVNPLPSVAPVTGSLDVCSGASSALIDATPGGVWASVSPGVATISGSGNVTGISTGNTTISYTVTNTFGCTSAATAVVTVNAAPAASTVPSGSAFICSVGSVLLSGAPAISGFTYQWQESGINVAGATNATYTASAAGNYRIVITNLLGCTGTSAVINVSVSASATVVPSVSITASTGLTVCASSFPVTFTATPVNGGTSPAYQWSVNGVTVAGTTSSYAYTPANGDIVQCILTSSEPCAMPATAIGSVTMTVVPLVTPSVSVNALPGDTICAGYSVTYTAAPSFGGSAPAYQWHVNGIMVATGPSYSTVPANGDIVTCTMTSSYATCITTPLAVSVPLIMNVQPVTPNTVNISTGTSSIISGEPVTFVAIAPNAGSSPEYQWFINSTGVAGATSATFMTSSLNNGDVVKCRVISSKTCALPHAAMSDGFTVHITSAIEAHTTQTPKFTLAPNPNNGSFMIQGTFTPPVDGHASIVIKDVLGKTIYTKCFELSGSVFSEKIILPNTLTDGMYCVHIISGAECSVINMIIGQ